MIRLKLVIFLTVFHGLAAFGVSDLLNEGAGFYEKGAYEEAKKVYLNLLKIGNEKDGRIYFNLGNISYRQEELGKSIFYFRKAMTLMPRNGDVKFNYNYVKKKTTDDIQDNRSFLEKSTQDLLSFSLKEIWWTLLALSILFWPIVIFSLFRKSKILRLIRTGMCWIWPFALMVFLLKSYYTEQIGVVVQKEVDIHSGIGADNVVLFSLHEGSEFNVLEDHDGWVKLSLRDGKKGWIPKKDVIF